MCFVCGKKTIQVFQVCFCEPFHQADTDEIQDLCQRFVSNVRLYKSSLLHKIKIHLHLHLSQNMKDFGPTSCFNTERFVTC